MQTYLYYKTYPSDSQRTKLFVRLITALIPIVWFLEPHFCTAGSNRLVNLSKHGVFLDVFTSAAM